MASTFTSAYRQPDVINITLGTAGNGTKLTTPPYKGVVWLRFRNAVGKVLTDVALADAGSIGASAYETCEANVAVPFLCGPSTVLFLASTTTSAVVEARFEEDHH